MQNRQEAEGVRQEATERKARKRQEASGNRQQLSDRRAAEDEGGESIKKRGGKAEIMARGNSCAADGLLLSL